jgi:glyoxylase-like metal-dependent hydrolase (beta-lactamase superfamily II)
MGHMTALLDVLCAGYAADRVASTVVLIRDQDAVIVVDPGMVADRRRILDPMAQLGVEPASVTDVVFSHHHPDHTLNAALFERARFHDHWAIYAGDTWTDRPADGYELSPSVTLMATPGHTAQDITTLVTTDGGLAACTHLWWSSQGPAIDPLAEDQQLLERSRARLLARGPALIVPGHGAPFASAQLGPATP